MARNMGMEICLSKMGECTEENFETAFPTAGAPIRGQMARGRSQDVTIKVDQQQVFWTTQVDGTCDCSLVETSHSTGVAWVDPDKVVGDAATPEVPRFAPSPQKVIVVSK